MLSIVNAFDFCIAACHVAAPNNFCGIKNLQYKKRVALNSVFLIPILNGSEAKRAGMPAECFAGAEHVLPYRMYWEHQLSQAGSFAKEAA